jgi:hypothetical protein
MFFSGTISYTHGIIKNEGCLLSMHKALDSISSAKNKKN